MARRRYPLPTLHERRCRRPCKACFRLAARRYREGVEPSGSRWKVSALLDLHRFPLPQAWPGASMDHARRRFVVALQAQDARAAVPVALFKQLYAVERAAREAGDDPDALRARREQHSRPVVARLHQVIAGLVAQAPPKSPLGKAVTYAINQWPTLTVFLDDPRVPLANAHVERLQRRTALGRKNYLFAGADAAAHRLAVLMTVVVNCELAGIDTFAYLRDVLTKIAAGWPNARRAELLPRAWRAHQAAEQQ